MASSNRHTVIIGTGSSIPPKVVPNSDFLDNEFFMDYGQPVEPGINEKVKPGRPPSKTQASTPRVSTM